MKLSKAQQNLFWRAFAPAWQSHCESAGINPDSRSASDEWRRAIIRQECGCTSLRDVGRGTVLDRLLKRLAIEAGDYARAGEMEVAGAERIRHRCADCARQICEIAAPEGYDLKTEADRWVYVSGVASQAYRGRAWLDITEDELASVFMMLDSYRRRLLKNAGWRGGRKHPEEPLAFKLGRSYYRHGPRDIEWEDWPV